MCAARMAGGRTFKATVDHTLMRGLDTAGPLIRLGLADCLPAGIGDRGAIAGHKGTTWIPGLALPPVTGTGDVGWCRGSPFLGSLPPVTPGVG